MKTLLIFIALFSSNSFADYLDRQERVVFAKKVIIATDAYTHLMMKKFKGIVDSYVSQVSAYKDVENTIKGLTITGHDGDFYYNFPLSAQYIDINGIPRGTLVIGGGPDRYTENPDLIPYSQETFVWVAEEFFQRFPQSRNKPAYRTWAGPFGFTRDRIPVADYISDNQNDKRVAAFVGSQGYGGSWCFLGGFLAAKMVSETNDVALKELMDQWIPPEHFSLTRFRNQKRAKKCSQL